MEVAGCSAYFVNEVYLHPGLRWPLGARGSSGSASCPADGGRLELEGMGGRRRCAVMIIFLTTDRRSSQHQQ
jgi:hypothetical protein